MKKTINSILDSVVKGLLEHGASSWCEHLDTRFLEPFNHLLGEVHSQSHIKQTDKFIVVAASSQKNGFEKNTLILLYNLPFSNLRPCALTAESLRPLRPLPVSQNRHSGLRFLNTLCPTSSMLYPLALQICNCLICDFIGHPGPSMSFVQHPNPRQERGDAGH